MRASNRFLSGLVLLVSALLLWGAFAAAAQQPTITPIPPLNTPTPTQTPLPTQTPFPPVPSWAQPLSNCQASTIANLRLRAQPRLTGARLLVIPRGATVPVNARIENWYRVIYNETQGWVYAAYVRTRGECR